MRTKKEIEQEINLLKNGNSYCVTEAFISLSKMKALQWVLKEIEDMTLDIK